MTSVDAITRTDEPGSGPDQGGWPDVAVLPTPPADDDAAAGRGVEALLPSAEPIRLLDADGTYHPDDDHPVDLSEDRLRALYEAMAVTRRVDREAINLQRQGQLGVYASCLGQEAAQVGTVTALDAGDWIFPSYRELGAAIARGLPPAELLAFFRGTWLSGHDPYEHRFALPAIPIATQVLHAAGFAMGAKLDGDGVVTAVYCGDGATSEGDFHEALNFAGVYEAPCVFVVQNNQWAISMPAADQTRAPSIAHKGLAYGIPGVRVDGNDVLACHAVMRRAVDRARDGGGPTLIEAVTYRMEAHTTSDDPTRYRTDDELDEARQRDPLDRMRIHLTDRGVIDDEAEDDVDAEAKRAATELRERLADAPHGDPLELFDHVYAAPGPRFDDQRARLEAELRAAHAAAGS